MGPVRKTFPFDHFFNPQKQIFVQRYARFVFLAHYSYLEVFLVGTQDISFMNTQYLLIRQSLIGRYAIYEIPQNTAGYPVIMMTFVHRHMMILFAEFLVMIVWTIVPVLPLASESSCTITCVGRIVYATSPQNTLDSPWTEFVKLFLVPLIVAIFGSVLGNLILDRIREQRQRQKDGGFKTPVVIYPLARAG
jgi:hypothetical protein